MDKTSIEKSHSKWSNFLLTLLALLTAISFSLIFIMIDYLEVYGNAKYVLIGDSVLFVLLILAFLRFKR